MRRFGLEDCHMVHLDERGEIDCYFTEFGGVTSLRVLVAADGRERSWAPPV
jgi:hypothetical protein